MCTDKNNKKNQMNLPPLFTVFLIAEKLASLLRNFQTFSLLLLTFCEKLSVIA